ncbi:MAG: hypothetical protein IJ364_03155 [Oscillospiraceae bacterium]|nr:hypothetical protein [Oscillospiraceae bacterium]
MNMKERMKRVFSILICLCMVLTLVPTTAFAVDAAEGGLCEHHTEHTAQCHYAEAVEGQPCTHVHDELCGYIETVAEVKCACTETDESGAVLHTEGCGYVAPVPGADCTHTHDDTCGYVASVSGSECTYHCEICHVQELIDALPGEVTAENDEAVAAQLTAIDSEKASLSDEELSQVDFAKYTAAAEALGSVYAAVPADDTAATITGVKITVDGTEYTNGTVTIPSGVKTYTITVIGTNLDNCTGKNIVTGPSALLVDTGWEFSDDNKSAKIANRLNESQYRDTPYSIEFSNDGGVSWRDTNIKILYNQGLAEDERAQITGASITVDGTKYTNDNATVTSPAVITPDSEVILTVTGANLQNGTRSNCFSYETGQFFVAGDYEWKISENGTTATLQTSGDQYAGITQNTQIKYSNDNGTNWTYTGIYVIYGYRVNVNSATNGTVTADKATASEGDTVTLTVTPAEGYVLDTLTVTHNSGNSEVTVTDKKFTMPAANVDVTASFKGHSHNWGYTAEGNVITATCANTDGLCGDTVQSITLNVPESYTYTGGATYSATVDGSIEGVTYSLLYTGAAAGSSSAEPPVNADTYTVTLSAGDKTVSGSYTIRPKEVTVTGLTAANREYNGEKTVTLSGGSIVGAVGSDNVTVDLSDAVGTMADANAGENKAVTVTGVKLGGTAAGNYELTAQPSGVTVTISPKAVTPTVTLSFSEADYTGKEHKPTVTIKDGETVIPASEYGVTYGDNNINAGTATVNIKAKTGGNYSFDVTKNFTINKLQLVVTASDAQAQVGDNASLALSYQTTGFVNGESFSTAPTLSHDATVTDGKLSAAGVYTITPSGAVVSGNYELSYVPGKLYVTAANTQIVSKIVSSELTTAPAGMTVEQVKAELSRTAIAALGSSAAGTAHYDVKLQFSLDGGTNWIDATEENFPTGGITITLPYPAGTGRYTHNFAVSHMFTVTSARLGTTAGGVETPPVTKTADGIQVTLNGLSPVALTWSDASYTVYVNDTKNGTVTSSHSSAAAGSTVTLTAKGKTGYTLKVLEVYDASGNKLALTRLGGGKYSFTMPSSIVSVHASFRLLSPYESPATGDDANIGLWMSLMLMSVAGMGTVLISAKKRKAEK